MLTIREKDGAGEVLCRPRTDNHNEAAQRWARRAHGRRATAVRLTGVTGLSGVWQAYLPAPTGGRTSVGRPFWVG